MDNQASDPPPLRFSPPPHMTVTSPPPLGFAQPLINLPQATQPRQLPHPSYEDMIKRAIMALNEKEGSSRQKIAKYIENEYHLPQSSDPASELTQELRKMKNFGQLVLVRHSYMLPNPGTPQPLPSPPGPSYAGPSPAGSSVQPPPGLYMQPSFVVSDGPKRRPGRPPKSQPIVVVSHSPNQTPSAPVGFAAFSPKQLGVPTTNLFGGFTTPAYHQFAAPAGPVSNVSTTGLVTGPVSNASTMLPLSGPSLNGVPSTCLGSMMGSFSGPTTNVPGDGPVSNVISTGPVNGLVNVVSGSLSNVSTGLVSNSGPVLDPDALAKVAPEQIDESAVVESRVDSVMVETGPESSAGAIIVSAAMDPTVALLSDGLLPVISTDQVAQNNDGSSTVLVKRGRGRPPKYGGLNRGWIKPAMYIRKRGRRGRPKLLGGIPSSTSTMSLRPRGRPRKNAVDAIVDVDRANGGAGASGVLPGAKMPWEFPNRSLGLPNKDVPDTSSLTREVLLMAYEGLKARAERNDLPDTSSLTPEIYLMAYEGLKARVEHHFSLQQTRIKSNVSVVKPYVNETAVNALGALQDLENIANMDVLSVLNGQSAGNVQAAPVEDSNAPVNGKDVSTGNIQIVPLTGESAQITFQGTPAVAEPAEISFQGTIPVQGQQQEPPLQS